MKNLLRLWVISTEGASALEYGLIAGGIALAIVAALFAMGDSLAMVFNAAGTAMDQATQNIDTTT